MELMAGKVEETGGFPFEAVDRRAKGGKTLPSHVQCIKMNSRCIQMKKKRKGVNHS